MSLSIGMFTYSTKPRGSVVCAASLAEALVTQGHHVVLYALDKDRAGFFRNVECELRMVPASQAPDQPDALIRQRVGEVCDYVDSLRIGHDVVHAQDCLVASGLLKSACRAPLVRTVHHVEPFESPYLAACQRRSIRRADACVSVSWTTHRAVFEQFGVRSTVVESGVGQARFEPELRAVTRAFRARFDIPEVAPIVLSVGGVEPRKNTLNMLEAFATFAKYEPAAHWVIVGGASIWDHADYAGVFAARLSALPAAIRRRVHAVGVLDEADLNAAYHSADVLLHAASLEGWGLSILEAMASGTSPVVSQGLPFEEYLDPVCATFVEPTSPASITRGLERAFRRHKTIADAARARASSFSWERSAQRHVVLYEKIMAKTPRHARGTPPPVELLEPMVI